MDKHQRGMALITVMVFLIVLSVVGIEALRNAALENKMSGNMQDQTHAFLLAESGIFRASSEISIFNLAVENGAVPVANNYTQLYSDRVGQDLNNEAPKRFLHTSTTYRGQSVPDGRTLGDIYSLDLVSQHNFHIDSTGRFNSAVTDLNQGFVLIGPKSED